jgi:hypothetical protein
MSEPSAAALLGASAAELEVRQQRTDVRLALRAEATRRAAAAHAAGAAAGARFYLVLEEVRGSFDATALDVLVHLPASSGAGDEAAFVAGSVGLYGLRRASAANAGGDRGEGLRFLLDVTPFLEQVLAAPGAAPATATATATAPAAAELVVSLRLRRQLPDGAALSIGRIAIYHQDPRDPAAPRHE